MRKKLLALALSMSMVLGLAGCGSNGGGDDVGGTKSKSDSTNVSGKTEEKEINGILTRKKQLSILQTVLWSFILILR